VIKSADPGQSYWYPGIAMAFLTRLAQETGRKTYEAGAHQYMEFFDKCAADRHTTLGSGKVGWGTSALYIAPPIRTCFLPLRMLPRP